MKVLPWPTQSSGHARRKETGVDELSADDRDLLQSIGRCAFGITYEGDTDAERSTSQLDKNGTRALRSCRAVATVAERVDTHEICPQNARNLGTTADGTDGVDAPQPVQKRETRL
jgi:hypothetical protein